MKIIKFAILLAVLPVLAFAQNKTISLKGELPKSMEGQRVTVMYGDFKKFKLDSARVKNGRLEFKLADAEGQTIHLSTGNKVPMDNLSIYVADADLTFRTKDSLRNALVKGHPHTEGFQRMQHPVDRLMSRRFSLSTQLSSLSPEDKNGPRGKALKEQIDALSKKERATTFKAIDDNPNSYIALKLLNSLAAAAISYDEMMPHYQKLSKDLKASPEGKALGEKILLVKNLRSGLEANDFESITPEGKKLKLSEVYPKSKYTFIDFWASWCAPCRAENPNVVKAYEKYGQKGLTILSVSLDTKAELWKEAIKKDGMPWLHVSQLKGFDEPAAVLYRIKMIPQNVLVDSNGKIVATNLRGYALEDKLSKLF